MPKRHCGSTNSNLSSASLMSTVGRTDITVQTTINIPVAKSWELWTDPKHITYWNFASDDWCCPAAINELRAGGKFSWRMEAKDGSMGFDFTGTYSEVRVNELIVSRLDDNREVRVNFSTHDGITTVTETFEVEDQNSIDLQRSGWQAILNNFRRYAEQPNG